MDIESINKKLALMQGTVSALVYATQALLQDINELKGVIESQEDDLR